MLGVIAGDIIGSVYEWNNIKTTEFPLFSADSKFTDDTVMTIAVADCLLNNKNYAETLKDYGRRFPHAGYGEYFYDWLCARNNKPNNSYGSGAAMRISSVGWLFEDIYSILTESKKITVISHNHPEAVKSAQAVASAIFLGRKGQTKEVIKDFVEKNFGYDLSRKLTDIRPVYKFYESCQKLVPEAIISFLESQDYESAVRNAISLGGDSDTMACIAGAIAEAFYGHIDEGIINETRSRLPQEFLNIIEQFEKRCEV